MDTKPSCTYSFSQVLLDGQRETLDSKMLFLIDYLTIATKLFKWKNLPKEIPVDIMEFNLIGGGRVVFFKDADIGYMALPTGGFGKINNYALPTQYIAIGQAGYTRQVDDTNSVIIKNDPLYMPSFFYIDKMCKRLADIFEAIQVNVNACKQPFIAEGEKEEMLSFKNAYEQVAGNRPLIAFNAKSNIREKPFQVFNTGAVYYGDKFTSLMQATECMLLTYLGINNTNIEKRERVNTQEVSSNDDIINYHLFQRLEARQKACEEINKMFGLDISVEINKEYIDKELAKDLQNTMVQQTLKEGDKDE